MAVVGDVEEQGLLSPKLSSKDTLETELPVEAAGSPKQGHAAACRALQASHFLSTWGQRGWEFCVALIMLELRPASLLLVAVWGLLDAGAAVAGGAAVGRYVDTRPRLAAASRMYLLQNAALAVSAAAALALLWCGVREGTAFWVGLAVTMAAGMASTLGALGSSLSVEREWTHALCGGDSGALASLNAGMKRIDLTCLIASPIMVGLLMQRGLGPPMVAATLAVLLWNAASWPAEVALLRHAQRRSPALAADRGMPPPAAAPGDIDAPAGSGGVTAALRAQLDAWALYARQPAAAAAVALALLYLTVMSWGTLMTAYLKALGLPEAELAAYRGLGALSGILATVTFPPLHRRLGLPATAALSIWLQLACLLAAAAPSVAAALGAGTSPRVRLYCLVWGLVLSRFGLWSFDLAANQLIQETAEAARLGQVTGVQNSLQSAFQMLSYLAGALVPAPAHFVYLMAASCGVVLLAAAAVTAFAVRTRCGAALGPAFGDLA